MRTMGNKIAAKPGSVRQTAAELYQVQPYYQRFNQKYNMTRQGLWDKTAGELGRKRVANLRELVEKGYTGYSLLDWGFLIGSRANQENAGFSINWPNRLGNSWQPLAKRAQMLVQLIPDRSFEKWHGSPAEASRLIRKLGIHFGADLVDFCLLDRRWVYSHWFDEESRKDYPIKFSDEPGYEGYSQPTQLADGTQVIPKEMQYVVVLIHEMNRDFIAASPTLTAMAETSLVYSRISFSTVSVAEFIRGLGYNAIPCANCTAISIPLAIDAGLGQLGRNAKLINPIFGPRCRISKVITDLPLALGEPVDFGVTQFCNQCHKCAQACPVGAIPFDGRSFEPVNECNHRGVLQWQVDHKKCYQYWAELGTNCGICIRVCPFNKGSGKIHDVVRWFVKNLRFADPLLLKVDDALGYGKYVSPDKLWREIKGKDSRCLGHRL